MAAADFNLLDVKIGDRVLNAAAIAAILAVNPAALAGVSPTFGGFTNTGDTTTTGQVVAAAGATQGNATQVPQGVTDIVVTVTASTEGIRLRPAATGRVKRVWASPAVGVKVYPATGQIIGAASTNVAKLIPKNTMVQFYAVDATHWRISA